MFHTRDGQRRRRSSRSPLLALFVLTTLTSSVIAEDVVELLNGTKVTGTFVSKSDKSVSIKVKVGSRTYTRRFRKSTVHAVTVNGKREVVTAKTDSTSDLSNKRAGRVSRSEKEVRKLISDVGTTPPDWYESTKLNYPKTLDLSWPMPPGKPWDNSKNVGQFIWDRINPNESKWREGVRFMHHLLRTSKDREVQNRAMNSLATMYHNLHEDYVRAAFWMQQTGVDKSPDDKPLNTARLANCYFQLGNRDMAFDLLNRASRWHPSVIKLMGDMGETKRATALADRFAKTAREPHQILLLAGDACRMAGDYDGGKEYYERVLGLPKMRKAEYDRRTRAYAQASLAAIQFFTLDVAKVSDGTYKAEAMGYEAPVEVTVVVKDGRILDVRVTKHREKQFYSSINDTPRKIIARQQVRGVDATTSATITSQAIINATATALAQGLVE